MRSTVRTLGLSVRALFISALVLMGLGVGVAAPASAATGSISGPSTAFVAQLVSFQVSGAPSLIGGTVTGTLMNGSTEVGTPVVVVGGQASLTLTTPRNPQQMSI